MAHSCKQPFLFINSDANHLKKRDEDVLQINSFMSKTRRKINRAERLKELDRASTRLQPCGTYTAPGSHDNKNGQRQVDGREISGEHAVRPRVIVFRNMATQNPQATTRADQSRRALYWHGEDPNFSTQQLTSLSRLVGGGPRGDPFITYPVKATTNVQRSFDFYSSVYAPPAVESLLGKPGNPLYSAYFQMILNDPLLFHVIIAYTYIHQERLRTGQAAWSPVASFHSQCALEMLHDRLESSENSTSNSTILAIVMLAACSGMLADFKGIRVHSEGLRKIVKLRGGPERLGLGNYLKTRVLQVEHGYAAWVRQQEARSSKLEYPLQPLSKEYQKRTKRLPAGFFKLCLKGQLSSRVVEYLESAARVFSLQAPADTIDILTLLTDGYMISELPSLNLVERVVMTPVSFLCLYCEKLQRGHGNCPNEAVVEGQGKKLAAIRDFSGCDDDCLMWAALILRETAFEASEALKFAFKILDLYNITWEKQTELETAFLPMPRRYKWLHSADATGTTVDERAQSQPASDSQQ